MSKIELAFATDYSGESTVIEETENMLKRVAAAGFTHIHWCQEWDGDYIYSVHEMKQIRGWMDQLGLKAKALHATKGSRRGIAFQREHYRKDYTSNLEPNRKAGVELIQNRIDLASEIGASEIVLHLYVPYMSMNENPEVKDLFYQNVYRSLDELKPYALEKGVRICFENLFDMPVNYMEDLFERIFGRYTGDFIGFCLDTGHANMLWREGMYEVIEKYGERLFAVHIHDNFGVVDSHMIPGDGGIDWPRLMKVLGKTAYQRPLTMELFCYDEEEAFLKRAHEAGVWLDGLMC